MNYQLDSDILSDNRFSLYWYLNAVILKRIPSFLFILLCQLSCACCSGKTMAYVSISSTLRSTFANICFDLVGSVNTCDESVVQVACWVACMEWPTHRSAYTCGVWNTLCIVFICLWFTVHLLSKCHVAGEDFVTVKCSFHGLTQSSAYNQC